MQSPHYVISYINIPKNHNISYVSYFSYEPHMVAGKSLLS